MNNELTRLITDMQWTFIKARLRHHLVTNLRGRCDEDLLDDLSQEVLLRVLQVPFDASGHEELVCKILRWIHNASRLVVLEWFRKEHQLEQLLGDAIDLNKIPGPDSHNESELDWPVNRSTISAAVGSLPPRMRTAVRGWMSKVEFVDIAKQMNCDSGIVRTYVTRGLKKLAKKLEQAAQ